MATFKRTTQIPTVLVVYASLNADDDGVGMFAASCSTIALGLYIHPELDGHSVKTLLPPSAI